MKTRTMETMPTTEQNHEDHTNRADISWIQCKQPSRTMETMPTTELADHGDPIKDRAEEPETMPMTE